MKTLIIDDVDYIRKSISKVLGDQGFDCEVAENGRVASDLVQSNEYDLIITDIMMPDMDGFEFLDFLREQPGKTGKTPVMAISGGSKTIDSDLALKMMKEKADLILQKPFSKLELLGAVTKLVGSTKLGQMTSSA